MKSGQSKMITMEDLIAAKKENERIEAEFNAMCESMREDGVKFKAVIENLIVQICLSRG